jgi:HPt (histidine-containing phosphotransfer) domain-containing protein
MDLTKNSERINILLIESALDESSHFIDVMKINFPNAEVESRQNSFDGIQFLQEQPNVTALVIEEKAHPLNAKQTLDYIQKELGISIPVFITSGEASLEENHILKPFSEENMKPFLEGLKAPSEKKEALYSLSYLMEISDGNEQFIFESIEIFQSSIKAQVEELKVAGLNNDEELASKIAHKMKPSFDMLENAEGSLICQRLLEKPKGEELFQLVQRLEIASNKLMLVLDSEVLKLT